MKDMTGILLLAHGSREGDTETTMQQITQYVKSALQNEMVEEAYLQFRDKNLEKRTIGSHGAGRGRYPDRPLLLV